MPEKKMSKNILIIDDETAILKMLLKFFESQGFEVYGVENAEEALEIASRKTFFCFFIDRNLAGADGADIFRLLKKEHPKASFFAMTGDATDVDRQECLDIGFDQCFFKPLEFALIKEVAKSVFEKLGID